MKKHAVRLFVAAIVLAAGIPSLFAMPDHDEIWTFYWDAQMTQVRGFRYYMCTGTWSSGNPGGPYYNISYGYECAGGSMDPGAEPFGSNCSDGIDNDGDWFIDCFDPDCWPTCP